MRSKIFDGFQEASAFAKSLALKRFKQHLRRQGSSWLVEYEGGDQGNDPKYTDNEDLKIIMREKDQEIERIKQQATKEREEFISRIHILEEAEAYLQHKLYIEPPEDILAEFNNTVSTLKKTLAEKEKEIISIKKQMECLAMYSEILELDLMHKDAYSWNEEALNKLSKENRTILKKYEHVITLRKLNLITVEKFHEFTGISGLLIALYNYEKVLHPKSLYSNDGPRFGIEICHSCGMAYVNGHCGCSNLGV